MNMIDQPDIRPVTEKIYRLESEYTYYYSINNLKYKITVPAGYQYDGATVPRFLWSITGIRPDGLIRAAALLHDYIYNFKGYLPFNSQSFMDVKTKTWVNIIGKWSRKDADKLFCRIMRESGVSKINRRLSYYAVRFFGWFYWP